MSRWTTNDMPDLHERTTLVTGANSGLGLQTSLALAAKGAHVLMASRNIEKAKQAQASIVAIHPDASLELVQLDLASLASIRACADDISQRYQHLDLLFNNAGVMAIPRYETQDGFEMQFGTNHLGHFALTGLLLPLLLATPNSRVVTTSSMARMFGNINLDDLNRTRSYGRWEAYGQSKTANLLFAFELQTRLAAAGAHTMSVAAHPGYANTNLQNTSAVMSSSRIEQIGYTLFSPIIAQPATMGALPQLYAGTSSDIHGGELVGPGSLGGMRGYPKIVQQAQREYDKTKAARLWDASVTLTGVDYAALQTPA